MIFTREIFEKISNEYKLKIDDTDTIARYLEYAVILYFPDTRNLSIWLGSNDGFKDADDYDDAVDKVEKCLAYISRVELEFKKERTRKRLIKMEKDFD